MTSVVSRDLQGPTAFVLGFHIIPNWWWVHARISVVIVRLPLATYYRWAPQESVVLVHHSLSLWQRSQIPARLGEH